METRRGRPPRDAAGNRSKLHIRISPAALAALERAMVMQGLQKTAVVDAALLAFAPPDRDGLGTIPLDLGLALPPPTSAEPVTA